MLLYSPHLFKSHSLSLSLSLSLPLSLSNGATAHGGPRPPLRASSILPGLWRLLFSFYILALSSHTNIKTKDWPRQISITMFSPLSLFQYLLPPWSLASQSLIWSVLTFLEKMVDCGQAHQKISFSTRNTCAPLSATVTRKIIFFPCHCCTHTTQTEPTYGHKPHDFITSVNQRILA